MAKTDDKDKPISAFELESTLDGNEFVPIVKDGVNYKTTLADVRSGLATEERVEAVEEAQAADLAKITELAGKLNGVQSVSEEFIPKTAIMQSTGDDKNAVVSQKTFTDELNKKANAIAVTEAIDAKADDFTTGYGIAMSPTRELSATIDLVPYLKKDDAAQTYATRTELAEDYATKNELDVVELLADSVNQGLGETIQRVDALETDKADKDELSNIIGEEVIGGDALEDIGKLPKYEIKERSSGEVVYPVTHEKCILTDDKSGVATKQYADEAAASILNSSPEQLEVINELGSKLADDSDLANAVTQTIATNYDEKYLAQLVEEADRTFNHRKLTGSGRFPINNPILIYHPETKTWTFDGIVENITPEEMRVALNYFPIMETRTYEQCMSYAKGLRFAFYSGTSMATVANRFTFREENDTSHLKSVASIANMFFGSDVEEVIVYDNTSDLGYTMNENVFRGATKLRIVKGYLKGVVDLSGCFVLEEIRLLNSKRTIDFSPCPKISIASLTEAACGSWSKENTIQCHPVTYAKINGLQCFNVDDDYVNKGNTDAVCKQLIVANHVETWSLNAVNIVKPFTSEDIGKFVYMNLQSSDKAVDYYVIATITNVTNGTIETTTQYGTTGQFTLPDNMEEWAALPEKAAAKSSTFVLKLV